MTIAPVVQRVGGEAAAAAGDSGRVAEGPVHVALSGAHLQLPRHHEADARREPQIHRCRQDLEGDHEASGSGNNITVYIRDHEVSGTNITFYLYIYYSQGNIDLDNVVSEMF